MVEQQQQQLQGKRVPWSQMEEYLAAHQEAIGSYLDQKKRNVTDVPDIEAKLPKSFLILHDVITKILRHNDIQSK